METLGQIVRRDGIVLDTRTNITPGARLTDDGRRIYRALAYDVTSIDRHGTTIAPNAFRAATLENLPVMLWHNTENLPVGPVVEWTMTEQGILQRVLSVPFRKFLMGAEVGRRACFASGLCNP